MYGRGDVGGMSDAWPTPEGGHKRASKFGDPLTPAEIARLGYELQPNGTWKLVNPDARPAPRPGLCRACQKFDAPGAPTSATATPTASTRSASASAPMTFLTCCTCRSGGSTSTRSAGASRR